MTSPHRPEGPDEGMEQAEEDLQFLDAQLSVSDEEYRKSLIELLFLEKGGDYLQINNFHARPSKTAIELVEENCPITSEQEEKDVIKSINQKTNKIGDHDSEETEIAPMEDQALDQDVAEKLSSSTRFTRAQLKEHDRLNSTEQNQQEEMYVVPRTESEQTTPVPKRPETSQKPKNGSPRTLSTVEKVLMANHFSDSQRSAYVERTVSQLKSQGLWSAQRLPKLVNKNKTKTNWDYVLGEMQWLATDFAQERKWKMAAARKISRAVRNYHRAKAERAKKEEREVYLKKRRTAAKIARMVHHFWDGINNVVQYKHKSLMEEKRQKILDIQLNYIVGQTERYSGYLTKQLQGESAEIKPIDAADTATIEEVSAENQPTATAEGEQVPNEDQSKEEEPMEGDDNASKASEKEPSAGKDEKAGKSLPVRRSSRKRPASEDSVGDKPAKIAKEDEKGAAVSAEKVDLTDAEFKADNEESEDDEETLLEEEQKETEGNHEEEIKELEEENDLSIDELMKRYGYEVPTDDDVTTANSKPESEEQDMEADNESKTEKKEEEKEEGSDHDEEVGLKFLVDGETPADDTTDGKQAADEKDGDFDSAAKQARDIQPTGHTLATTQVKTPIPKLLRGELREYQHIGLNWLVTLYNERLNGILADEMGLGKTIQTIALLAHLACEKGVWGPHLIVVPTSVMLNWEMEFKKWAPGFKILTYYGSQKERKMKRTGWSKSNAFHVCITSYKLVVQDHAAFRRKKWRYFILDEAHNIKNFKSQRWQALLNFNSQRRLLLTGTPLQNNLMELWSLMHFLMPHLFQSRNDFKEWFANPMDGMVGGEAEYNDGIIQRLHKVLRPFLLRRLKKEVEKQMPNKYEHVVRCHLSKRQRYLYEDFMSRAATRDTLSKGDLMSVMNVLMQLRKVCNHPNLFEPRPIVTSFNTKALVYETPSIVASATIKDSFQEICLDNVNLNLQRFCGFSTFDVDSIHTLRPARKMIEELISAPPTRPLPKKTSIPGDMRKRIMESLKKKTISAYQNRLEEVKKNAAAALSTKESSSVPYSTHHSSSSTAHKLISFANSTALRNNISQGRSLHAPTSSANPQRRMAANGQIVQLTAAGRIQIYSNARGLSGSGALDRMKGGNKRLDAESYSKWLTRIQQTRKAETLARIARVNEKRCDMSNQCLSANVISMLQGITLNKKKPVYDNRYYQEIISIFTNVLYKKVMEEETLSKIDLLVPSVEAPCMQLNVQHLVPWKEYGLKTKKDFIRNYFRNNYPSWKMNARKLLFPETQLIEYDCGKLQVLNILLRQFISGKHRVLIFTQMTKVLDILEVFLNYHGYRYLRLDGSTHIEERMIRMERFNNDKRIFCFILSTRSGGIGVNLTGADTVVFYDSDWNPTMDAQAQDRCHRIGQTRDVHIYRLISERTVEENILRKANQKRMLNNLAIEGGHFTTHFFTKHGLKDIFDEPCSLENIDEEQKAQAKKAEAVATAAAAKKSETSSEQSSTTTATAESTAVTCGGNTDEMAFGEALLKSEDKEDQNAAEMVEKEQMAEMEEFGEQQNAAATEESKVVTRAEEKIRAVYEQLTPLQRFAVEFIERNSELSFDDQIHQAKEDLERAKKTWEVNHLLSLKEEEERRLEEEEDDIFYVCADGINQVSNSKKGGKRRGKKKKKERSICFPDMPTSESEVDESAEVVDESPRQLPTPASSSSSKRTKISAEVETPGGGDDNDDDFVGELISGKPPKKTKRRRPKREKSEKVDVPVPPRAGGGRGRGRGRPRNTPRIDPAELERLRLLEEEEDAMAEEEEERRQSEAEVIAFIDESANVTRSRSNSHHQDEYNDQYLTHKSDPLWVEFGLMDMIKNQGWSPHGGDDESDEDEDEDIDDIDLDNTEDYYLDASVDDYSRTERLLQNAQARNVDFGPNEITSFSRSGRARKKNKWLSDDYYDLPATTTGFSPPVLNQPSPVTPPTGGSRAQRPTLSIVVETPDPPPTHHAKKARNYSAVGKKNKKTSEKSLTYDVVQPRPQSPGSRNVFSTFLDDLGSSTPSSSTGPVTSKFSMTSSAASSMIKRNVPSTIVSIIPSPARSIQPKQPDFDQIVNTPTPKYSPTIRKNPIIATPTSTKLTNATTPQKPINIVQVTGFKTPQQHKQTNKSAATVRTPMTKTPQKLTHQKSPQVVMKRPMPNLQQIRIITTTSKAASMNNNHHHHRQIITSTNQQFKTINTSAAKTIFTISSTVKTGGGGGKNNTKNVVRVTDPSNRKSFFESIESLDFMRSQNNQHQAANNHHHHSSDNMTALQVIQHHQPAADLVLSGEDDDFITLDLEPVRLEPPTVVNHHHNSTTAFTLINSNNTDDEFAPENEEERNFFESFESLLQS